MHTRKSRVIFLFFFRVVLVRIIFPHRLGWVTPLSNCISLRPLQYILAHRTRHWPGALCSWACLCWTQGEFCPWCQCWQPPSVQPCLLSEEGNAPPLPAAASPACCLGICDRVREADWAQHPRSISPAMNTYAGVAGPRRPCMDGLTDLQENSSMEEQFWHRLGGGWGDRPRS